MNKTLLLAAVFTAYGVMNAYGQEWGNDTFYYPPEVIFTQDEETKEIIVNYVNILIPSKDEEIFTFETETGSLVILITREDGDLPDSLTVIDIPQGFVVIGESYKVVEEKSRYDFKVVPYVGF